MDINDIYNLFQIDFPIADKGVVWNGQPDEFSNIGWGLSWSQQYGMTPYAKTGVYGYYNGKPRPHNGHDYAGFEGTPLVLPIRAFITYSGYDDSGYGNHVFFESESKSLNGETVKCEYVLAHMSKLPLLKSGHWYDKGTSVGFIGSSGMSTGNHDHFGIRPWRRLSNGGFEYFLQDEFTQAARGYVDPLPFLKTKPIYNKQELINIKNMLEKNEKKIIIEGQAPGRKYIVVNGKLREITKDREANAALYVLANNGFGQTMSTKDINSLPKDLDF